MRIFVVTALLLAAGCHTITTKVPGVLDLRSDGASLPTDSTPIPNQPRASLDGFIYGEGVTAGTGGGADFKIIDRKYWALQIIPVFNESATEEITLVLANAAVRDVKIGEEETLMDFVISLVGGFVPGGRLFTPPRDVFFSGTRLRLTQDMPPEAPPVTTPGASSGAY